MERNPLPIPANAGALEILTENGLNEKFEEVEMKKLFLEYCIKVKSNITTIDLIGEYTLLRSVIEIVMVNFLASKLSKERFNDFNEQYQEQNIVP